jgi:preprotein translocase subunit SecG
MPTFLALLGMFISVLLIGIILLQRGRGGGLVGALSGLGGQSAFGTKAGDTFTRITIGIAAAWVLLAGIHGQVLRARTEKFKNETAATEISSTSKDKDSGSTKSDGSKTESGLGSSSSESKDAGSKAEDSKSETKKTDESSKELTPEEDKKSDSAPKSKEPPKKEFDESTDVKSDEKGGEKK